MSYNLDVENKNRVLQELSREFDKKLARLNEPETRDKINELFSSDVENNRITRPISGNSF